MTDPLDGVRRPLSPDERDKRSQDGIDWLVLHGFRIATLVELPTPAIEEEDKRKISRAGIIFKRLRDQHGQENVHSTFATAALAEERGFDPAARYIVAFMVRETFEGVTPDA